MVKRLTRKDIADKAGVSPSTVSRALAGRSDLLPEETITHICAIAEEMGYTKNMLASRFASNKSYQIGFVVPLNRYRGLFQTSYYSTILDAMVTAAYPKGYTVSIAPVEETSDIGQHLSGLLSGRQVDGVVIAGLKQNDALPEFLESKKIPATLVGSYFSGQYVGSVNCDPTPAIRTLIKTLESRGYKRLHFVTGNKEYYDAQVQLTAIQSAVAAGSLAELHIIEGDYSRRSGYAAAETVTPDVEPGDCVFLANDRMAMGFYRYCYENHISIPDTISVVGSDDDEAATTLFPDLTTIRQPRQEMGRAAVNLLIERIEGTIPDPFEVTLEKTFCLRKSLK